MFNHRKSWFALAICLLSSSAVLARPHHYNADDDDQVVDEPSKADADLDSQPTESPDRSRAWRWELFGTGGFIRKDTTNYTPVGADVNLDPGFSGGAGVGFNLGPCLNLNFSLDASRAQFKTTYHFSDLIIYNHGTFDTGMLNLEIYPFKGPITPVLTAAAGFANTRFDTGDIQVNETDFAYCAGGGVRWDFDSHFFAKALYKITWTRYRNFDDTFNLQGVFLSVGYAF